MGGYKTIMYFSRKSKMITVVTILILLSACFFLSILSRDYEETQYEIDYILLSKIIDFYDEIDSVVFTQEVSKNIKIKVINSFANNEIMKRDGNRMLINNLKNIKAYNEIKKFVHNSELQIARIYPIIDNNTYSFDDVHFFISIKKDKLWGKNRVFLFAKCNDIELKPIMIIE